MSDDFDEWALVVWLIILCPLAFVMVCVIMLAIATGFYIATHIEVGILRDAGAVAGALLMVIGSLGLLDNAMKWWARR